MKDNLTKLLSDPRFDQYMGQTALIRLCVLARHLSGAGSLAEIARKHRVSKAALTAHAKRACDIYGPQG